MLTRLTLIVSLTIGACLQAPVPTAGLQAFSFPNGKGGTLEGGGFGVTVASYFYVRRSVRVNSLGFEQQPHDLAIHAVGIFEADSRRQVAMAEIAPADSLDQGFYYHSVTPTQLLAGHFYYLAAYLPKGQKYFFKTNRASTPEDIQYVSQRYGSGIGLQYPWEAFGGPMYFVANFKFSRQGDSQALLGPTTVDPVLDESRASACAYLDKVQSALVRCLTGTAPAKTLSAILASPPPPRLAQSPPPIASSESSSLLDSWRTWQGSNSSDDLDRFLAAYRSIRQKYTEPSETDDLTWSRSIGGQIDPLHRINLYSAYAFDTALEPNELWKAGDAVDVTTRILQRVDAGEAHSPEFNKGIVADDEGLKTYLRTGDTVYLDNLLLDLDAKNETTPLIRAVPTANGDVTITVNTFVENKTDSQGRPVKSQGWLVYWVPWATPQDLPTRIGDLSSPVKDSISPGTYYFYAQRDKHRTRYEQKTVYADGIVKPPDLYVDQ